MYSYALHQKFTFQLTCMSGRSCTQGTANLPFLEGSQPFPGTFHGNADHNWYRRAGPVNRLDYRIVRSLHHLQLKSAKLDIDVIRVIYIILHVFTKRFIKMVTTQKLTFVNGQFYVFWAVERETPEILKCPSCPCTGVMVKLSTSFSTALNGCSKALTVCTVLRKEKHPTISCRFFSAQKKVKKQFKQFHS